MWAEGPPGRALSSTETEEQTEFRAGWTESSGHIPPCPPPLPQPLPLKALTHPHANSSRLRKAHAHKQTLKHCLDSTKQFRFHSRRSDSIWVEGDVNE